jgi:serine/threonine protein kinase
MNPDRWRKVEKIFNQALEVDQSCRAAVIEESCAGDETLRFEVESLLAQHENAESFIETPAFYASDAVASQSPANPGLASDLGHAVIGHYRILGKIGGGGQGVVYEAEDLKLGRHVALKFLPEQLAQDPQSARRFRREARAASALNHPNICTVHEVDEVEGRTFIAMEFVPGKTLDKVIPPSGLNPAVALGYAIQVADALSAAHAAAIVHRDVKPSNLMVNESGRVKVLDFGLAKLEDQVPDGTESATTIVTNTGMIIGTLAYMSPEQAEGKAIDVRSDVFSFGSVLYEMLSGRRAFVGQSRAGLLSAVMRDEPTPLVGLKHKVPPELRRIVARCLQKAPEARYPSAVELSQDLKKSRDVLFPESATTLNPARLARHMRQPRALVPALIILILIAIGVAWLVKRSRDERWARNVALPEIYRLNKEGKTWEAYALAVKAEKLIPGDPTLAKLWPDISLQLTIESMPSGAEVYSMDYTQQTAQWTRACYEVHASCLNMFAIMRQAKAT